MSRPKIRLHVEHPLGEGQTVDLSREQANYLFAVMRLGRRGPRWPCSTGATANGAPTVARPASAAAALSGGGADRAAAGPAGPLAALRADQEGAHRFHRRKGAEMGAARIMPVQTEFTNAERIRRDRLQAHAVEAAEQCGGTYVPPVEDLRRLSDVLADWPEDRHLSSRTRRWWARGRP
jgi:16S rRNA (uracil1498-N3)-methyltransferase